jgi:hypothetical protein
MKATWEYVVYTIWHMSWWTLTFWLLNLGIGLLLFRDVVNGTATPFQAFMAGSCLTTFVYGFLLEGYKVLLELSLQALEAVSASGQKAASWRSSSHETLN